MGTFRDYICNECASAEGAMPRPIVGPLRGTATQRKNYATHLGSRPAKATNGVFNAPYHSTTAQRVIFDEAVANGAIEVESGDRNSTNLVMAIPSGVAQMESKGAAVGPATAFRVVNSSLSHEPHGYPVQLGPVACRKCGAPALGQRDISASSRRGSASLRERDVASMSHNSVPRRRRRDADRRSLHAEEEHYCGERNMNKKRCRLLGFSMIASIGAVSTTLMSRAEAQTYSREQFERWQTELSNWGRWGKDDQIGVLNLITPEKRVQAMALAKKGVVVSLQRKSTLMKAPPVQAGTDEPQGVMFYEVRFRAIPPGDPEHNDGFSGEVQRLNPHGGYTHVDAICHDSDGKGHLYNGADLASSVSETGGCLKSGLDSWPNGAIVTRGILVDMTRLKAAHTPGAAVTVADLEAWEKQTGLRVSPGDALFAHNPGPDRAGRPTRGGFDLSVLPWMKVRGVALTSGFHSVPEASYGGQVDGLRSADHRLALASMGLPLLDSPDLVALSAEAARQNRWEFMLIVAPHVIPGGTGQLVNPLAMF